MTRRPSLKRGRIAIHTIMVSQWEDCFVCLVCEERNGKRNVVCALFELVSILCRFSFFECKRPTSFNPLVLLLFFSHNMPIDNTPLVAIHRQFKLVMLELIRTWRTNTKVPSSSSSVCGDQTSSSTTGLKHVGRPETDWFRWFTPSRIRFRWIRSGRWGTWSPSSVWTRPSGEHFIAPSSFSGLCRARCTRNHASKSPWLYLIHQCNQPSFRPSHNWILWREMAASSTGRGYVVGIDDGCCSGGGQTGWLLHWNSLLLSIDCGLRTTEWGWLRRRRCCRVETALQYSGQVEWISVSRLRLFRSRRGQAPQPHNFKGILITCGFNINKCPKTTRIVWGTIGFRPCVLLRSECCCRLWYCLSSSTTTTSGPVTSLNTRQSSPMLSRKSIRVHFVLSMPFKSWAANIIAGVRK